MGDDEEGPESGTTEGEKPGIRSAAEALPRLRPCFVSRSQRRRPHGLLSGEVTGTRWVAHAALACLCFALSVPTSSRRLGPAGCRCGLLPTWPFASPLSPSLFVLLSSFLAMSLRRARLLSAVFLQAPLDCGQVPPPPTPSSPWPSPRENEAILVPYASVKSSRRGFRRIRASPSEMRGKKGFPGSCSQQVSRPPPVPKVCFPQHPRAWNQGDERPEEATRG